MTDLHPDELLVYTLIRRGTVLASTMEYLIDKVVGQEPPPREPEVDLVLRERVQAMCAKLWEGYSTDA